MGMLHETFLKREGLRALFRLGSFANGKEAHLLVCSNMKVTLF